MDENSGSKPGKKGRKTADRPGLSGLAYVNKEITEIVYERDLPAEIRHQASTIAFISGKTGSTFIHTVIRGVEDRIRELGRAKHSLLFQSPRNGTPKEAGIEILKIIKEKSAGGIIVASITPEQNIIDRVIKSKVPVVLIERHVPGLHSVKVDNFNGGFMAAQRLAKSGRKKPGVIIDTQTADTGSAAHERLLGFKAGLKASGIKFCGEYTAKADYHTIECGRICMDRFGKKINRIDSVFSVAGDTVAIGFMIEAKSQGIRIPRDLAVIGFDDMDAASAVEPALTTIRQPIEGMGKEAVNIINDVIKGKLKAPKNIIFDAEFIIRESA